MNDQLSRSHLLRKRHRLPPRCSPRRGEWPLRLRRSPVTRGFYHTALPPYHRAPGLAAARRRFLIRENTGMRQASQKRYHPRNSRAARSPLRSLPVSYTHLRAHETRHDLVCRLLLEKKKKKKQKKKKHK